MSDRTIVSLASFAPRRRLQWLFAAAALAAAAPDPGGGGRGGHVQGDRCSGTWQAMRG